MIAFSLYNVESYMFRGFMCSLRGILLRAVLSFIFFISIPLPFSASPVLNSQYVEVRQNQDLAKLFSNTNTTFYIRHGIDLKGKTIRIGKGSILFFDGGYLSNGTVVGNQTRVIAADYEIFKRGYTRYRAYIRPDSKRGEPPKLIRQYHNSIILEGTWDNKKCGFNWTGLQNRSKEDIMLALKNYILLHALGTKIVFPSIDAFGYETTWIPGGYDIDFNYSSISYPNNLGVWEDKNIEIPSGTFPCPLESGFGLISVRSNTTISNLSLDGKASFRKTETVRLGVSCLISIGNSSNVILDNVRLSNALGPGVVVNSGARDITFRKCKFFNIGEHVLYSHQYLGYCHFQECTFDTWDSERLSAYRKGLNYLYKYAPPVDTKEISYEELYDFQLLFSDCTFNNPKRVDSNKRILGGFFTGYFPLTVNLIGCRFLGEAPPFNPGRSSLLYESCGKPYRLIVRDCDGAPYVYPAQSNYNIIAEFYNCVNIPFRTVFAKRYEDCSLNIDTYEISLENISSCFEDEFKLPLVVKNCVFLDGGRAAKVIHPIHHRPIVFESCRFSEGASRSKGIDLVTIQSDNVPGVSFFNCLFDIPYLRMVGGARRLSKLYVERCEFRSADMNLRLPRVDKMEFIDNSFSNHLKCSMKDFQIDLPNTKVRAKGNKDGNNKIMDSYVVGHYKF